MKVLLLVLLVALASAKTSYNGYEVWRVEAPNRDVKNYIHGLRNLFHLDFWGESKTDIDIMVNPMQKLNIKNIFSLKEYNYDVVVEDVQDYLEKIEVPVPAAFAGYDHYNTLADIEAELLKVSTNDQKAELTSIGKTIEGRDQWAISFSTDRTANREAIYFDCGIHAREWVTVSTCMWGVDHFSNTYGDDNQTTAILDKYDVHIVAVANPDGYNYTWSDDRLWRKNRRDNGALQCMGVDLNRNFDDSFGGQGTSNNTCDDTYKGESPASEPETKNVQDYLISLRETKMLNTMYSIHAYSQLWMWPYGNTTTQLCPDNAELDRVGQIGVDALKAVNGTVYETGPIAIAIYPAASTTVDFAYSQVGITYSYTLELRPHRIIEGGFQLAESEITITAEETWAGLKAAVLAMDGATSK